MSEWCKGTNGGWQKYPGNPVLGRTLGTCFDITMLQQDGRYIMYFSWRDCGSIARTTSADGVHWDAPEICIEPREAFEGREDDLNRPSVVLHDGIYYMWYTGQFRPGREDGTSDIFIAKSTDGVHFDRVQDDPVIRAELPWEKHAVMCPTVLWDDEKGVFRMWYSGGGQNEPDAIGYAESTDGIHWQKYEKNPVFMANPNNLWERHKAAACQVLKVDGWYWMFYIGYHTEQYAQIGIARSRTGIDGWERSPFNPIVAPDVDSWDDDACYKPFVLYDPAEKCWRLWYNGRRGDIEQIGMVTLDSETLIFE